MRKHLLRVLVVVFTLVLAFSGCDLGGGETSTPENPNHGDVYEDYNPDKKPGGDQFDYDGNYVAPELTINGMGDDAVWGTTPILAKFGHGNAATVKAYRGELALFFLFEVKDVILLTEGETNDDAVTRSDSIEFYLDTLANGGLKPQNDDYQINLGIHGKTRIMQGSGSGWGNWNGLIDYEVTLNGVLNDSVEATDVGYCVEVMIPYTQINIEKEDTIAVSFGQVDKFNLGSTVLTDWDWAGWTFNGVATEPQSPDNYVLLDKYNRLIARDQEERGPADIAGYVLDEGTQLAISGVTVTANIAGSTVTTVTDEQGYFEFKQVDSNYSYTVTVEKDGFYGNSATYARAELRAVNGGRVLKTILVKNKENALKTQINGTVKNLINGVVAGATVSAVGTDVTAISDSEGKFSLVGVPSEDGITLSVSANGYGISTTKISADALTHGGISEIGELNINLPYANSDGFGNKNAGFADSIVLISRSLTGIEFHFFGTRELSGQIELYLDTKESADHRDNDETCWRFDLFGTGIIGGSHFAGGSFTANGLVYDLTRNDASGYEALFFIPYTYLGIEPTEVFGISLGQWSTIANDWDGWGWNGQFRAPETPETYVRIGALNNLYVENTNFTMVTLSGNVGIQGVKVEANGVSTTSNASGYWSMKIPQTSEEVVIKYSRQGYKAKQTVLPAGYFESEFGYSENVQLYEQYVTVSGTVIDIDSRNPIVGASVIVNGTDLNAFTDEEGRYEISDIPTLVGITLRCEATDYAKQEISIGAIELASKDVHEINVELVATNRIRYYTATGFVTNVNGAVAGATVAVEGNSELTTVTDGEGKFEIASFPGVDSKIIISKAGYIAQTLTFSVANVADDATVIDFGTTDMWLEYKALNGMIADKSDGFGHFKGYVTRSATGFEFLFNGSKAFNGRIELFVDTKTSAGDNARDNTDYLFNLNDNGMVTIVNWASGGNEVVPTNMLLVVENKETAPVVRFTLPYAFFGQTDSERAVKSTEVIGISLGQWSTSVNDWDGWDNFAMFGINGVPFVKPEMPVDYIRLGAHNEVYAHINNDTLNLNEYAINFATGESTDSAMGASPNNGLADNFYAKVSNRNETGVTFSFITTGAFGKEADANEMVLVYFDMGTTTSGGWADTAYLLKIHSNGDLYARKGSGVSWWKETDADKIGNITIKNDNGVITFDVTVTYEQLGIGATEVFGVCMREASALSTTDHHLYDPWYDCYFNGNHIDAANTAEFARVAADGTLYSANNNS